MPMAPRALLLLLLALPPSDPVVDAMMKEGRDNSRVMDYLERLVGPRLTSSTKLDQACEWTRGEFEKLGLKARLEPWGSFPVGFDRGPWSAKMIVPETMPLTIGFNAWTPGTEGPMTGPAILAPETDRNLASMREKLKGAWVISSERETEKYRDAYEEAGVAGVIRTAGGELIHTWWDFRVAQGVLPRLRTVSMLGSQHQHIVELLRSGKDVQLTIDIDVTFRKGPIPLYNVIAELPGSEKPDELVIVGGHLDSWDGATGATDNGTGVAVTLEAARLLTAARAKPRRTIRFMLWTGEEQGILGSRAYVKAHPEENPKISAVLVHDGGTNYVSGILSLESMLPSFEKALEPLLHLDGDMRFSIRKSGVLPFIGKSDHESYLSAGVPGFRWLQSGRADYAFVHHTQHDTLQQVIPEYQRHSAMVVAVAALRIADLPELLPRTGLRVPPRTRSIGVRLDDAMKVLELTRDGPAEKAGVRLGDGIVALNGEPLEDTFALAQALKRATKEATLRIRRDGKDEELRITLPD